MPELEALLRSIASVRRLQFQFSRSCGGFVLCLISPIEDGAVEVAAAVCVVFCHLLVHLGGLGVDV